MRNKPLQSVALVLKYRKHASTMIGTPFAALGWWSSAKARLGRHVEQAAEVCSVNARLLFDQVFRRLIFGAVFSMSSANSVVLFLVGRVIGAMFIGSMFKISSSASAIASFLAAANSVSDSSFESSLKVSMDSKSSVCCWLSFPFVGTGEHGDFFLFASRGDRFLGRRGHFLPVVIRHFLGIVGVFAVLESHFFPFGVMGGVRVVIRKITVALQAIGSF